MRVSALLVLGLAACADPGPVPKPVPPPEEDKAPAPQARRVQPRSFRFVTDRIARPESAAPPMSLTASDGTGLSMVALDARAVVRDPLAFTELRMTFQNPENRVIEGQFKITLPPGAKLSRFAMAIDGRWQEGEVVEKQAARRAYEDFLHRKQDPALLEQAAGNEFTARVFPIPAGGTKELILSYSQELASAEEPYRLPLRGLPRVGKLDVHVKHDGAAFELHEERFVPDADVEVAAGGRGAGRRDGELVVMRVPLVGDHLASGATVDEIDALAVLVDTSASRALGWSEQMRLVDELLRGLANGDVPLLVTAFDQQAVVIYEGPARGWSDEARARLAAHRPLGASNLHGALTFLARHQTGYRRVLVVSDGVATAGPEDGAVLRGAARELAAKGVERIDALVVGGLRDEAALGRLVSAGLPRDGAVIDGRRPLAAIGDQLTRPTLREVKIDVAGASWFWPKQVSGKQVGDEILVYAHTDGEPVISVAGRRVATGKPGGIARPLLARAIAGARIDALIAERELLPPGKRAERSALEKQIVSLSVEHRVLSPFTALLVLETEADYRRFGIARQALADILTVEQGEIAVLARGERPRVVAGNRKTPMATKEEPAPAGGAPAQQPQGSGEGALRGQVARNEVSELDGEDTSVDEKAKDVAPEPAKTEAAKPSEAPADAPAPATSPPPPPPPRPALAEPEPEMRRDREEDDDARRPREASRPARISPYTGEMAKVMRLLARKDGAKALETAWAWRSENPGDVMALIALGEALEKTGDPVTAARAYGSLIDLFPGRADLRRFAGERLERLTSPEALALAADSYGKAAAQRPDHPASHRLHAFALVKQGLYAQAFDALAAGLKQSYPDGRFEGVMQILREDLGLVAAAWMRAEPARAKEIAERLRAAGGVRENGRSLRFVLNWETDANDVDFHITDRMGNHAFYSQRQLASGGELYADVTTGYGPECFTIRGKSAAGPYKLEAHYYSRGPMGYGMGKLQVIRHDGKGNLSFEERPFVVMQDQAYVALGTVK